MQGILKYNLPEDQLDFELASKAIDISLVLNRVQEKIRYDLKHDDEIYNISGDKYADKLLEYIQEEIKENNITIVNDM